MKIEDMASLSLVALILLAIFVGALVVIKKRWLNKKRIIYELNSPAKTTTCSTRI